MAFLDRSIFELSEQDIQRVVLEQMPDNYTLDDPRPIVRGAQRLYFSKERPLLEELYSDGAVTMAMMHAEGRI